MKASGPYLFQAPAGLSLASTTYPAFRPLHLDFTTAEWKRRVRSSLTNKNLLIKAVGASQGKKPQVLDASFGLGGDSAVLAAWGCEVTACERVPELVKLWNDAADRAHAAGDMPDWLKALFSRLEIKVGDARSASVTPDTVLFDPMYPEGEERKAAPKKAMQLLRELCGDNEDATQVGAELRKRYPGARFTVKRPPKADLLFPGEKPDVVFSGKAVRFDVYLPLRG